MSFALKKLVCCLTMACFALGGTAVAAKTVKKAPAKSSRKAAPVAKGKKDLRKIAAAKDAPKRNARKARVRHTLAADGRAGVVRASLQPVRRDAADPLQALITEDQKRAQELRQAPDASSARLTAASAFMFNQDNGQVLFEKNPDAQLPMASLTKLMTALVVMRSNLPMNEAFTVAREDYYLPSSSFSRLRIGMTFTRDDLLHIGLTGSDNRAIHLLARSYPGGLPAFVQKMNETAKELGLKKTVFEEPTGLSAGNRTTAREITRIAAEAYRYPKIREYTTSPKLEYSTQGGVIHVRSTNRLIREGSWDIGMQKTGYTGAAGHCMMLQTEVGSSRVLMVVLNSTSNNNRILDMKRMRDWYEKQLGLKSGAARLPYNLL